MSEKKAPERIILGSGYIHLQTFKPGTRIPDPWEFCTDENRFSYISGGASLEYSSEYSEATDDMGKVSKTILTTESVLLKSGIMTLDGNTIEVLCDTARVKVSDDGKHRIVKIGGVGNRKGAKYVICFHHVDPVDGDIYVMIVGQNQAGFTLSFAKEDATVVDVEFHAIPNLDEEGTLVTYVEEIPEEQQEQIDPVFLSVPAANTSTDLGTKKASDLQGADVKVLEGGGVVGTFPFVKEFKEFSTAAEEQKGNYFFIELGSEYDGKQYTIQRTSGTPGKAKQVTNGDKKIVMRIADGTSTTFKITADNVPDLTLNFTGATVSPEA